MVVPKRKLSEEELAEGEFDEDEEIDLDGPQWNDPSPNGQLGELFEASSTVDGLETVQRLAPLLKEFLANATLGPEGDTTLHLAALYNLPQAFNELCGLGRCQVVTCSTLSQRSHH